MFSSRRLLSQLLILATCFGFHVAAMTSLAGPYDKHWTAFEDAKSKALPKSAVEALQPIIDAGRADENYPEAIRALALKIAYEGQIQGRQAQENIVRLEEVMGDWPEASQPILETVLAQWYWHFFQQNRWRFMQRTQTADPGGDDIMTWDLARILRTVDEHFQAALADPDTLRAIPIADYESLFSKTTSVNAPDEFRPTLYDFIAHQALSFYSAGEQAGAKAQDAFVLSGESPILGTLEDFVAWEIETSDEDSPKVKGIHLLQDLIRYHQTEGNAEAVLDNDLVRLRFGNNHATGAAKQDRYIAALKAFAEANGKSRISARARQHWAQEIYNLGDRVSARKIAKVGLDAHPNTPGGNGCYNLIQQIEAAQIQIFTERVWDAPLPTIDVLYRNLTEAHFRIVKVDWEEMITRDNRAWNGEAFRHNDVEELLKKKPVKEWSFELPATDDFQQREERLEVPEDLKTGFYAILSSTPNDFSVAGKDRQFSCATFWVSDLALVTQMRPMNGSVGGFVLDAESGEPIAGAKVAAYRNAGNNRSLINTSTKTDDDGQFEIRVADQSRGVTLLASKGGQKVSTPSDVRMPGRPSKLDPFHRTFFFTDRSIYRPGQSIQYKGITALCNHKELSYEVESGRKVTVVLLDVNRQEVTRSTHVTNDFGSFTGTFTAPRDRLMGRMTIQVDGRTSSQTSVTVEEYKRPKFKVEIDPPAESPKLRENVTVVGKATSYSGAAIDGGSVTWRVVREVRYPAWWGWRCWWMPVNQGSSQEIANGTGETAVDGSFEVSFDARPDEAILESAEPTFHFTVYADITDGTGETRSDSYAVVVGYTALQAAMSATSWQEQSKPVEVTVTTRTLAGEPEEASGTIKIHRLVEPKSVQRRSLRGNRFFNPYVWRGGDRIMNPVLPEADPTNPNSWELGEVVTTAKFQTDGEGNVAKEFELQSGFYRAILETSDRLGKKVSAELPIRVLDPKGKQFDLKIPNLVDAPKWSVEPGEKFSALWGTGYEEGRAFIQIFHRNQPIEAFWTTPGRTQQKVVHEVTEDLRGGFTLIVTQVRENRLYTTQRRVDVPWSQKKLSIKWEHHTSKLEPGSKETWTAVVSGPDAENAVAEVAAALYDESLDAYLPHRWAEQLDPFYRDNFYQRSQFQNQIQNLSVLRNNWSSSRRDAGLRYRAFPSEILNNIRTRYSRLQNGAPVPMSAAPMRSMAMDSAAEADAAPMLGRSEMVSLSEAKKSNDEAATNLGVEGAEQQPGPDLDQVSVRTNLNETAFFFPHMTSAADGTVRLEFTMPEALTTWKFLGFAHDKQLRSGFMTDSVITQKDIMVQPNPPRFLREADALEFTVKVINLSPTSQSGNVRLTFADARTEESRDEILGNKTTDQNFEIPAKESRTFSWRIDVPDRLGFLTYKAVASTGKISDGESGFLPVLPRKILVTESLPLPIRGIGKKSFSFDKLLASGDSDSLDHESLTVQMVSNPAWYAVMALPYLMEYPHQCSEQIFNRIYANSLASYIAGSDPKIRDVFDQWRGTDALDSPLEKNEDIKQIMLQETPWVRQSQAETKARNNVGILFEANRLTSEMSRAQKQLAGQQLPDGAWPWFPGGRGNDYITLYITTGYGRLRHLGVEELDMKPAMRAIGRLDNWIVKRYDSIVRRGSLDANNLNSTIALYLYGRSFFLEDVEIPANSTKAVDYFLGQSRDHWTKLNARQSQAHLALALTRFGVHKTTPKDIMKSLDERSVSDEEMGMFWRDTEYSYWWYRAPIETQAVMIEAFDEVAKDDQAVEDLKVWLLKQKQTQDWKTTKATADAIYALLLRGTDVLASDALVEVSLGGTEIEPDPTKVEAGTGFFEQKFLRDEVLPGMGEVELTKTDEGVSWGSVHWQYLESMEKITPHEGTPLTLKKALYTKVNTKKGPVLTPVEPGAAVGVGDELVVRLELRTDRDMEYVHLKDQRGSGTEPVNVLSKYHFQDGLAYYESTRDTASHFFIDYLPKGTYVFEYSVRVQHRGRYQTGIANIQCMYAPEFNSHSESFFLMAD